MQFHKLTGCRMFVLSTMGKLNSKITAAMIRIRNSRTKNNDEQALSDHVLGSTFSKHTHGLKHDAFRCKFMRQMKTCQLPFQCHIAKKRKYGFIGLSNVTKFFYFIFYCLFCKSRKSENKKIHKIPVHLIFIRRPFSKPKYVKKLSSAEMYRINVKNRK